MNKELAQQPPSTRIQSSLLLHYYPRRPFNPAAAITDAVAAEAARVAQESPRPPPRRSVRPLSRKALRKSHQKLRPSSTSNKHGPGPTAEMHSLLAISRDRQPSSQQTFLRTNPALLQPQRQPFLGRVPAPPQQRQQQVFPGRAPAPPQRRQQTVSRTPSLPTHAVIAHGRLPFPTPTISADLPMPLTWPGTATHGRFVVAAWDAADENAK